MNNYNNDRGGKGGFNKNRGGFDRGGFGGGNRNHGGGHRGGGNKFGGGRDQDDRPKEMHTATCATCQKSCQVPFRPSGDKPVYCSDCFSKNNDRGGERGRVNGPRPNKDNRFPARQEHPNDRKQGGDSEIKQRLATIEAKLNKILDLINPPTAPEKKAEKPVRKESAPRKEVDMPALKDAVAKATKAPAAKKAPAKKAVAKKTTVKKVIKKAVAKKATTKKVVKKKK